MSTPWQGLMSAERMNDGSKVRILLIPDAIDWILGTWAKEIVKRQSENFDFLIFPIREMYENPQLFKDAVEQVDAVHCLTPWGYSDVLSRVTEAVGPAGVTMVSSVHHIVDLADIADCLKAPTIMVVCKKYLRELMAAGVSRDQLHLVYNGVNVDRFAPMAQSTARDRLGIPHDVFTIGFSGKATSDHDGRKGIGTFCEALGRFRERADHLVHVVLTGPGWEILRTRPEFTGMTIHHFPFLPDEMMPVFYNAVDVYLVTARIEGGPVPLLEAMSCQTAVITTPVGTALDYVENDVNGLLVPIGDVSATVDAIELLYRQRELRERLAKRGRDTIVDHLQWRDTLSQIAPMYLKIPISRRKREMSPPFEELNAQLIQRDSARWMSELQRQQPAAAPQTAPSLWKRLLRRLSAR